MPIVLKKSDISKKGWQDTRHKNLKASGVGKALDTWKPFYTLGVDNVFNSGKTDDAQKAGIALSAALGKARNKASAIKNVKEKTSALALVKAYEKVVGTFQQGLLDKMDEADRARKAAEARQQQIEKKREVERGRVNKAVVCGDQTYMKAFLKYAKSKEASEAEATAAILWEKKQYLAATLKYGPNNQWNQDATATSELIAHYNGSTELPPPKLKSHLGSVAGGFEEMIWNLANSLLVRFKKSDIMNDLLEKKFPI